MGLRPKQKELHFQDLIIDSYRAQGGYGKKWASDRQVGVQDLIVSLRGFGVHLIEVKHRPDWRVGETYKNPMEPIQVKHCRDYLLGGGTSFGAVVFGSSGAIGSSLFVFDGMEEKIRIVEEYTVPYVPGRGFDAERIARLGADRVALRHMVIRRDK